jgi:U3 small nucleolar ribonucleoprotein protein IMP3
MGRKLKYHEHKLLKKTNLFHWRKENNIRIGEIMARYGLGRSEEYHMYNRLAGKIQHLVNHLRQMNPDDRIRIELTRQLVDRLRGLGIIETATLADCERITVASICKRRLPVVLKRLKFCETVADADRYVRQGHVRIGPDVITDPAAIITTEMEDFIGWAHGSKIQQHVQRYKDAVDDFDELQ